MAHRIPAERADTKSDILRAAESLIRTHGYDATSVQTIIDAAQVSKGAFYYYFKTKEELLDALIERMTHEALMEIRTAVESEPLTAVARLNRFLAASKTWRLRNLALLKGALQVLMRDENAIIREKSLKRNIALVSPLLIEIIRQGIDEGVFRVTDASDTAELILQIWSHVGEKHARVLRDSQDIQQAMRTIQHRADFAMEAVERLLGAPAGSIERHDVAFLAEVMSALHE